MASSPSLRPNGPLPLSQVCRNSSGSWRGRQNYFLSAYESLRHRMDLDSCRTCVLSGTNSMHRFVPTYFTSDFLSYSSRRPHPVLASVDPFDYDGGDSYIAWLLEVLHESARITCISMQHQEPVRRYPRLANAWVGVDVDVWQRHVAYQDGPPDGRGVPRNGIDSVLGGTHRNYCLPVDSCSVPLHQQDVPPRHVLLK